MFSFISFVLLAFPHFIQSAPVAELVERDLVTLDVYVTQFVYETIYHAAPSATASASSIADSRYGHGVVEVISADGATYTETLDDASYTATDFYPTSSPVADSRYGHAVVEVVSSDGATYTETLEDVSYTATDSDFYPTSFIDTADSTATTSVSAGDHRYGHGYYSVRHSHGGSHPYESSRTRQGTHTEASTFVTITTSPSSSTVESTAILATETIEAITSSSADSVAFSSSAKNVLVIKTTINLVVSSSTTSSSKLVVATTTTSASGSVGTPLSNSVSAAPSTIANSATGQTLIDAIVDTHNTYRAIHGSPALTWSSTLADYATSHASSCEFAHTGGSYGENLAEGYSTPYAAITAWYNEESAYNYTSPGFSENTGHFTQLVWKATTEIGCANINCGGSGYYLMCEYYTAGNVYYSGQSDPYILYEENVLAPTS